LFVGLIVELGAMVRALGDVYGAMMLPYRSVEEHAPFPEAKAHGRAPLPQRRGVGTESGKYRVNPVQMPVRNGRSLLSCDGCSPSLDAQGFQFVTHETALAPEDFFNVDTVLERYFPEVEAIVKKEIPNVAKCLIFDHTLRSGGELFKTVKQVNPYAAIVHTDATVRSLHTRAKDQILGTNETEVKYGRLPACWGDVRPSRKWQERLFRAEHQDHLSPEGYGGEHLIINVWRPIQRTPVSQWPLALLDASTIDQRDVHPSIILRYDNTPGGQAGAAIKQQGNSELSVRDLDGNKLPMREGEIYTPLPDPGHQWYVFPQMTMRETLLIKILDSRRDGRARFSFHAAGFDAKGDPNAQRASIEVRCLVILEPTTWWEPTVRNASKL